MSTLCHGACERKAGLCDGGGKRPGGGKGEKGASQRRSHDIARSRDALELQRGFRGSRRVIQFGGSDSKVKAVTERPGYAVDSRAAARVNESISIALSPGFKPKP
jgi:hypothetical protein